MPGTAIFVCVGREPVRLGPGPVPVPVRPAPPRAARRARCDPRGAPCRRLRRPALRGRPLRRPAACAVLAAPPGTGKTTLVPLALAGRRRRAGAAGRWSPSRGGWRPARPPGGWPGCSARRSADGSATPCAASGGSARRHRRRGGHHRRAAAAAAARPGAARVSTSSLLDECHERHLDADTAMAFLLDVRPRPCGRTCALVAASATTDTAGWSPAAGRRPGGRARAAPAPGGRRVGAAARGRCGRRTACGSTRRCWTRRRRGAAGAARARRRRAVLPARRRRDRAGWPGLLRSAGPVWTCCGCTAGRPPPSRTRRSPPGPRRRVCWPRRWPSPASTVPGVRVVVDAGLAREPRTDHARGLGALTTVAGLAGGGRAAGRPRRTRGARHGLPLLVGGRARPPAPGTAPEIAHRRPDRFALPAACWGDPDGAGLALLDAPPPGASRRPGNAAAPRRGRRRRARDTARRAHGRAGHASAAGPRAARRRRPGRRPPGRGGRRAAVRGPAARSRRRPHRRAGAGRGPVDGPTRPAGGRRCAAGPRRTRRGRAGAGRDGLGRRLAAGARWSVWPSRSGWRGGAGRWAT